MELKINEESEKFLKAKFIRPIRYVQLLANIVHVMKKNRKLWVCVDFRNLNVATVKPGKIKSYFFFSLSPHLSHPSHGCRKRTSHNLKLFRAHKAIVIMNTNNIVNTG